MTFNTSNKLLGLLLVIFIQANAANNFDKQRPDNIGDKKWSSLKAAVQENNSKLLPTPDGVGGKAARFGESVSIDGNRALIGSPVALEHGVAYIYDYDGTTWNETQVIFPDDINAENRFGISVSLQGDRVLIGDKFNRVNGAHQSGAAYVYDLNNGVWELTQKLIASDLSSTDQFGISVSLSGDRALIGAVNYDDATNGNDSGAAYVFDYDGSDWQESAILTATAGSSGDQLGISVSLDGDKALVGSSLYDDNNNGVNTGSAYLFEFNGVMWSQEHQFLASDGVDADKYGIAVSLSANRVLIGASDTDENFTTSGSAYVYEFNGSIWQETKLLAPDAAAGDRFGASVSIENNRLLVGAGNGEVIGVNTGSAYIYDFNSPMNEWNFTQEIAADDITTSSFFTSSIGLSGDKVIVGNFGGNDNGAQSGVAYVFDLNGSWQQTQKLVTLGAADDNFGYAVSLDGNRALIGAPFDDNENGSNAGNAYIFDYINGQWSTPHKIISSDYYINFGSSVSLSGNTAIIGANRIDFSSSGQAYIFDFDGSTWNETIILTTSFIGDDEFAYSVSLSGDRALVGAIFDTGNEGRAGTAHIFEKSISGWQPAGKLMASDGATSDAYGVSVSLDGDRALVGAYTKDDVFNVQSRAGAAYVYDYDAINDSWEETKLQAIVPSSSGFFGWDVEVQNDRAIIGATGNSRSAYVFDYDSLNDSWNPTKLLSSANASSSLFGNAVSIDGDRALVGAYYELANGIRSGSVYQYEFDGTNWTEVKKHIPFDAGERDYYGWAVGLSRNIALIGSYQDDDRGTDSGSVYTINDIDQLFTDGFED